MRSKLTAEDVAWLERRLSTAMVPVAPRAEFVNDAKRALLNSAPDELDDEPRSSLLPIVALLFTLFGLALLATALRRRGLVTGG